MMTTAALTDAGTNKSMPVAAWICLMVGVWPVGLAIALVDDKREDWIRTHYKYIVRTIMISLLYCAISFVLSFVLIGMLTFLLTGIWYIIRCVKGLVYLSRNEAIPNPGTWMW